AALLMAVTRTLVRAAARTGADPAACLDAVNRQMLSDGLSARFVSLFYGVLDTGTGVLGYSLGGHPPPYLLRAGGKVEALEGVGFLVGAFAEASFDAYEARLGPGDLLLLYTDGVTEARGPGGALWTADALEAALQTADRSSAEALVRGVVEAVRRF